MRWYRALLRLFPRAFRERWGDDMERLLADRLRESGGSRWRRTRVRLRAVADVLTQVPGAWRTDGDRSPPDGAGRPAAVAPATQTPARLDAWTQDLRGALRSLRRAPGLAAVAILTLGLGIGANAAVFAVVNSVLLRPLPYADPEHLVEVWPEINFNGAMVRRVGEGVAAFDAITGVSPWAFVLTGEGEGEPEEIVGAQVSHDHFEVLGVAPALGRGFRAEEALPGSPGVVVLSHRLWTRRYGGDPGILGRRIRVSSWSPGRNAGPGLRTVVGVMPSGFRPVEPDIRLWVPLQLDPTVSPAADSTWHVERRIARLAPGATVEQAEAQLRAFGAALHEEWPRMLLVDGDGDTRMFDEEDVRRASVRPLHEFETADAGQALWLLLAVVALLLLMVCTNVANLLLAHGEGREHDLAVRRALGADEGRIVRQVLLESLLLGAGGAVAGALLGGWTVSVLTALAPAELPRVGELDVDATVLAFVAAISLLASLALGLLPARQAVSGRPLSRLQGTGRGARGSGTLGVRRSAGAWLIGTEVAVAVVVLVACGLMLRTLHRLYSVDPGFRPEGVVVMRLSPPIDRYPDSRAFRRYFGQVRERLEAVPPVESVGGIHILPFSPENWSFPSWVEDHPVPQGQPAPTLNFRLVSGDYFAAMGIPLLQGELPAEERADGPTRAAVNEALVERFWPHDDPIGKRIRLFSKEGDALEVAAVVGDVRQRALDVEARPEIYVRHEDWPWQVGLWLVAHVSGDPAASMASLREAAWSIDPDVPVAQLDLLDRMVGRSAGTRRFVALLLASFAVLALALSAVGVYGVTSYTVARRSPEFGVRMALGASRRSVLADALGQALRPVWIGLLVGCAGALAAADALAALLFGISPRDPLTLAGVAVFLSLTAFAATLLPAWRASRLDPMRVLREE